MRRPSDSVRDSLHSLHTVTLCLRSIYTTLYIVVGSESSPIVTPSWIPFVPSLSRCRTSSALSLSIRAYLGQTSEPLWLNKHPKSAFVESFHWEGLLSYMSHERLVMCEASRCEACRAL